MDRGPDLLQDQREAIVACARSYLGTPIKRGARTPGAAMDCGAVPLLSARGIFFDRKNCRIVNHEPSPEVYAEDLQGLYTVYHWRQRFKEHCNQTLNPLPGLSEAKAGSVILFKFYPKLTSHCGVLTERNTLIHAWDYVNKVCEVPMSGEFLEKFDSAYDFRSLR